MAKRAMPDGHYKVMQERARTAMKNKTDKLEKAAAGYDTSRSRFFVDGRRVWEPTPWPMRWRGSDDHPRRTNGPSS